MVYKTITFCLLLFYSNFIYSNKSIELFSPIINIRTLDNYGSTYQIWDIEQDSNGVFYYATQQGLVRYNGINTKLFTLPSKSAVRSLALTKSGDIFIGATDEFGFISSKNNKSFQYVSLSDSIESRGIGPILKTFIIKNKVYFIANNKRIFVYQNRLVSEISHIPLRNFRAFKADSTIYLFSSSEGLWSYNNENFELQNTLLNEEVYAAIPYENNQLIIGTINKGLFLYNKTKNTVQVFNNNINKHLDNAGIYKLLMLKNGHVAVATLKKGLYIINVKENSISNISAKNGLINNSCLTIFQDKQSDLWVGHETGTSQIQLNTPFKIISSKAGIEGSYRDVTMYYDNMYVATSSGIFSNFLSGQNQSGFINYDKKYIYGLDFCIVKNPKSNDSLLLAATLRELIMINRNNEYKKLLDIYACQAIKKSTLIDNKLFLGGEFGLMAVDYNISKNSLTITNSKSLSNFTDPVRDIEIMHDDVLWVRTSLNQIFRISIDSLTNIKTIKEYKIENKHEEEIVLTGLYNFHNTIYVTSNIGLFKTSENNTLSRINLNSSKNTNEVSKSYIQTILYSTSDNLYISTPDKMFGFDIKNKSNNFFEYSGLPEPIQYIKNVSDVGVCALGTKNMYLIKPNFNPTTNYPISTIIETVKISGNIESYEFDKPASIVNIENTIPRKNNSISIWFSAPFYRGSKKMLYSTKLEGFETSWSEYNNLNHRMFTNLSGGHYKLLIKSKNIYGQVSNIGEVNFAISKPWYLSNLAISIYIFLALVVLVSWLLLFYRLRKQNKSSSTPQFSHKNSKTENILSSSLHDSMKPTAGSEIEQLIGFINFREKAILIIDDNGFVEWISEGFVQLYGYKLYEILVNEINVLGKNKNELLTEAITFWERSNEPLTIFLNKNHKNGEHFKIKSTLTPVIKSNSLQHLIIVDEKVNS